MSQTRRSVVSQIRTAVLLKLLVSALAIVSFLAWLARGSRRRWVLGTLLLCTAVGLTAFWPRTPLRSQAMARIGTFNIRFFHASRTDLARVAEQLNESAVEVMAVQEIQDLEGLERVASLASNALRHWRVALSACGGKSKLSVGFLYDSARVSLESLREFPSLEPGGDGHCTEGDRSGLLARFQNVKGVFELLVVHFAAGGTQERARIRREQWMRAVSIMRERQTAGVRAIGLLGDVNSTGFEEDQFGERAFILELVQREGLTLATQSIGCTAYWSKADQLRPSVLDHIVATPALAGQTSAHVEGYCRALSCRAVPSNAPPGDYQHVSDHCPVVLGEPVESKRVFSSIVGKALRSE